MSIVATQGDAPCLLEALNDVGPAGDLPARLDKVGADVLALQVAGGSSAEYSQGNSGSAWDTGSSSCALPTVGA